MAQRMAAKERTRNVFEPDRSVHLGFQGSVSTNNTFNKCLRDNVCPSGVGVGIIGREIRVHCRLSQSIVCLGSEGIVINVANARPGSSRSSISNESRAGRNGAVCPIVFGRLGGNDGDGAFGLDRIDSVLDIVRPGMDQNLLSTGQLG